MRIHPGLWTTTLLTICACLLLFLSGCGDNRSATTSGTPEPTPQPTPEPTPQPPPPPPTSSKFIYGVPGFEPDGVFAGTINANTGKVSLVSQTPFRDGLEQGFLLNILGDQRGRFLFTMRQQASSFGIPLGFSGISAFRIDRQSGALVLAPNAPIIFAQTDTHRLFLDGLGRFLYQQRVQDPQGVDVYAIDQNTGQLTKAALSSNVTPLGENFIATPDGRFIFNAGQGAVQTLAVDATGQLSLSGTPISAGGSGGPVAISADGKVLFVANSVDATVSVFAIGTNGQLTPAQGSPFPSDAGAVWLAVAPNGKFLYGLFGAGIEGFSVDPTTASVTKVAGFTPLPAKAFQLDGAGKFAFASDLDVSGLLITYSIDPNTGLFSKVSTAKKPITDLATDLVTTP